MNYTQKLKDPRWIERRNQIYKRDGYTCRHCSGKNKVLNVHHIFYLPNREPWEYPDNMLITLCKGCHGRIEDLKKMVGILATNKSVLERLWAICHAHEAMIDRREHQMPLQGTPDSAEACFKAMRDAVEEIAA